MFMLFNFSSKAQQQKAISATIVSIDKIDYYYLIKAISNKNDSIYTILSKTYEKNDFIKGKDIFFTVKIGCKYDFILQPTYTMKSGEDEIEYLHLEEFRIGNIIVVKNHEVPYVALNMFELYLYK